MPALACVILFLCYRMYNRRYSTVNSRTSPHTASVVGGFKDISWSNVLTIFLNGTEVQLINPDPDELLAYFIRDKAGLKGTKLGCEEGGCGACTVVLAKKEGIISVNSCLRPLCANDGMAITTVEGVGSVKGGLSEEQKRLTENNGTQCGYCTPGWITNMHALNTADGKPLTQQQIDKYLDGHICRCTGYKPILASFQSFGTDASLCGQSVNAKNAVAKRRNQDLVRTHIAKPLMFFNPVSGTRWIRPVDLNQLRCCLKEFSLSCDVQLMGGNTSIGVSKYLNGSCPRYEADAYKVVVDVNEIPEFHVHSFNKTNGRGTLTVGAGITINRLISLLRTHQCDKSTKDDVINPASVFSVTAAHLHRIAGTQVRNAATWAGNLMLFLKYPEFPSDAVLALTTANATLQLGNYVNPGTHSMTMEEFLHTPYDLFLQKGYFLQSVLVSESTEPLREICVMYKVAQRSTNAHAHVNAGFNFQLRNSTRHHIDTKVVCNTVRVVVGGVSSRTFVASKTEKVLCGAPLDSHTLQRALVALQSDLAEVGAKPATEMLSQTFRDSVMQTCLYRALLACYPIQQLPVSLRSAVLPWDKPASRGTEVFVPSNGSSPVGTLYHRLCFPSLCNILCNVCIYI